MIKISRYRDIYAFQRDIYVSDTHIWTNRRLSSDRGLEIRGVFVCAFPN